MANVRHHAIFCGDRSKRSADMANYRFSIWLLSAILDFQTLDFLTAKVQKFGCNRRSNFDSIQFLIFCALSLKMPIHAPK